MSRRPAILGGRRWMGVFTLVCLALGQAATMVVAAFATRDVFMNLRDGGSHVPFQALSAIAAAGLALFALRAYEGRVAERTGQSFAADIREALFEHITRMPTSAIARKRSGALALRYVGDLSAFKGWVSRGIARLISSAITIPAALLILYLLDLQLLLAALGPIAGVMIGILLLGRPLGVAHAHLRSKKARLAASMAERLPQGVALRRSGRMRTELKRLGGLSAEIIEAAVKRASLAATVRALPDAGAGLASGLCLYVCVRLNLGVADAVAALTALALVVWPLRHLADVTDRMRAYGVASAKLDALMASPRLPARPRKARASDAPPIRVEQAKMLGTHPVSLTLRKGEVMRLDGPSASDTSALLLMLAGFEAPPKARRFDVLGRHPARVPPGRLLYLGRHSPQLQGSLRREATMGIGRTPKDDEIEEALRRSGLEPLAKRIGGLRGRIDEGRRNLTAREQSCLLVMRGLLARPDLALIDASEVGLNGDALGLLLAHFKRIETAVLIVASDQTALPCSVPATTLKPTHDGTAQPPCIAA